MHYKAFRQFAAVGLMIALAFGPAAAGIETTQTESLLGSAADPTDDEAGLGIMESLESMSSIQRPQEMDREVDEALLARGPALHFEPNHGQSHEDVEFLARADGYTFFLTGEEAVFVLPGVPLEAPSKDLLRHPGVSKDSKPVERGPDQVIRMQFEDPQETLLIQGQGKRVGVSNYLIGDDPSKWATNVPHYAEAVVHGLWPGIDAVFLGTDDGAVRFDFHVHPGADPQAIRFSFEGAQAAIQDGALRLGSDGLEVMRFPAPYTFQEDGPGHKVIESGFQLSDDGTVSFTLGPYDPERTLVIDPVAISYSTYLGGSQDDAGYALALDEDGNVYVTGETWSSDFPTQGGYQNDPPSASGSAFVTKLSAGGDTLVYSTYLGGGGSDLGWVIDVDENGNAYVAGTTWSTDFPTVSALQNTHPGNRAGFVAKLAPTGDSLVYSTYYGGSGYDDIHALKVDDQRRAHFVGKTTSTEIPTQNPLQDTYPGGGRSGFVATLQDTGDSLVFGSYLGGDGWDSAWGVYVDDNGARYITGETSSADFSVLNAFQDVHPGGDFAAFVTKIDSSGTLEYSTYLGGTGGEAGHAVFVDGTGDAYVTGITESHDFPTQNPYQDGYPGGTFSVFVTKLASSGDALVYSTYLGGTFTEVVWDIAVDAQGHAVVTGPTESTDFPLEQPFQETFPGDEVSVFVTKLAPSGDALEFSSYLGGSKNSYGVGLTMDNAGDVYITGVTIAEDFPVKNAYQDTLPGVSSAFITKLTPSCQEPGPDAYGYLCRSTGPTFEDISGFGTPLGLGNDDLSAPIDITDDDELDPFLYYGKAYKEIRVGSNGYIQFGDGETSDAVIRGYWSNLRPDLGGEIHVAVEPSVQRTVVQYTDVEFVVGRTVTFQVVLDHSTNEVHVAYGPIASAVDKTAITRIEDPSGGVTYGEAAFHSPGTGFMDPGDGVYIHFSAGDSDYEIVDELDVRLVAYDDSGLDAGEKVTTQSDDHLYGIRQAPVVALCYWDEEDNGLMLDDPIYLSIGRTQCDETRIGDLRFTATAGHDAGSFVDAGHTDIGRPLDGVTGTRLMYYDLPGSGQYGPDDPVYLKTAGDGTGNTVEVGDLRLTSEGGFSSFTRVRASDMDATQSWPLSSFNGDPHIDTPNVLTYYDAQKRTILFTPPDATIPSAPQNLIGDTTPDPHVLLEWDVPEDNGMSHLQQYHIHRGPDAGSLVYYDTVLADETSYTDTDVNPGETWVYAVLAENDVGEGPLSNTVEVDVVDVPDAPQDLVATAGPEAGEISLEWTAPEEDGGSSITDYRIYSGTTSGDLTHLDTVPATQTEYTDSGLGPGETWFYEVKAENAVGEGDASNEDSATTFDVATQPTAFDVTSGPGKGEITLSWQAPLDDGGQPVTEYRIYRGNTSAETTLIDEVDASITSFTDTGLGDGVQRFYNVSAVNAVGEGESTDTFGSTTQPADEPAHLPEGKSATSATIQDGIAYVFGGRSDDGSATDTILRFHPETNNVTVTNATLLTPRLSTSAVWADINDNGDGPSGQGCHNLGCIEGYGFIFGGLDTGFQEGLDGCHNLGCAALNEILRFDPVEETVEKMEATFPEPVFMTSSVWDPLNEVAYIFGGAIEPTGPQGGPGVAGCHNLGCMRSVMIFNANEDSLTPHDAELPVGLAGTSAVWDPVQNVAYIFGGTNEDGDGEDRIFKFDPSSTEVDVLPATLPGDRWNTSAVFDGQHAYILGGENENGMVNEIVRFNPLTDAVEVVGFLPTNRTQTSAVFDGTDVYIIGGLEEDGESTDEIVKFTPTAPQQAQAQPGPGVGQNHVSWSPPLHDGGEPVETYRVYRVEDGGLQRIAVVPVETTHYVDDGLENGTTYQYRVSAVNLVGEGPQSPLAAATTFDVPGAPQAIDATPGPAFGEITIEWDAPEDDGRTPVTQYNVYRAGESEGPFQFLGSVPGTNQSFTDTGLGELETFHYRVHAVNLVGEGSASQSAQALTYDPMNLYVHEGGPTLEDALKVVAPGGTIHIAPGTYEQEVVVDKNITIQQGVADGPVSEDAQGAPVVIGSIQVHGVTDFTIKDLHLQATPGGQLAGTAFEAQGALRLDVHNVTFIGDGTPQGVGFYPGLVDVQAVQQFTFTGNLVDADPATAGGVSGLRVQSDAQTNATLRLENNTFRHANGAGLTVQGDNPQAMLLLQDNVFTANHDGLVLFETVVQTIRGEGNQWTNNTAKGVRYVGAVQGESVYRYNQFTGNDVGFAVSTLSDPVDARINWWGSPAGPLAGDQANMLLVDYTPWCLQEDCSLIGGLEEGLGLPLKDPPGLPLMDEPAADVGAKIRS